MARAVRSLPMMPALIQIPVIKQWRVPLWFGFWSYLYVKVPLPRRTERGDGRVSTWKRGMPWDGVRASSSDGSQYMTGAFF